MDVDTASTANTSCSSETSKSSATSTEMATFIECPVCFDVFSITVIEKFPVMVCREGHSICNTCADPVHQQGVCPICRKITLPNGGIINRLALDLMGSQHKNGVVSPSSSKSFQPASSAHHHDQHEQSTAVNADGGDALKEGMAVSVEEVLLNETKKLADDLFCSGYARSFLGSYTERNMYGQGRTDWMCKMVLKAVSTRAEYDAWISEQEFTVLGEGDELLMFSCPEDVGFGSTLLIGHITWTNVTVDIDFNCNSLNSSVELVAGSYDPTHRLLSLRGIGVRQKVEIIAATGYLLHVSNDGRYVRGWCRAGAPDSDGKASFSSDLISLATAINLEEIEGF
jgi:hypothetical protein